MSACTIRTRCSRLSVTRRLSLRPLCWNSSSPPGAARISRWSQARSISFSAGSQFLENVFNRNRKPAKVADYAEELFITPNYLNRLVRAQTGHSAMDWIEISRLNLAKSLLRQGELQIAEIATAVGIDDQSYFTRFFKKNEGVTPSQYRESVTKGTKNPE